MSSSLKPRPVAVVTGANSGIGLAVVAKLLEEGYFVWGQYFSRPNFPESFGSENFAPIQANLTEPSSAEKLFEKITGAGGLDALVNLVGPFDSRPLREFTPADWNTAIQLNLNTAFNAIYYARPSILRAKGQIINFTYAGVENIRAVPDGAAYAAAKAGVAVLTKSLAVELAKQGVRVNAVAPGWMQEEGPSAEKRAAIAGTLPTGRLGQPGEVAEVVAWLLQKSPAYITGATISVGGGWEL